jgi:hypothetical protein
MLAPQFKREARLEKKGLNVVTHLQFDHERSPDRAQAKVYNIIPDRLCGRIRKLFLGPIDDLSAQESVGSLCELGRAPAAMPLKTMFNGRYVIMSFFTKK